MARNEDPHHPLDKSFLDLVAQDVRGHTSTRQRQEVRSDKNLHRRHAALVSLKKDVEVQLVNHKSRLIKKHNELVQAGDDGRKWKEYLSTSPYTRDDGTSAPSPADWRARAIQFLKAIEDHLGDVKARRRDLHGIVNDDYDIDDDIIKTLVDSVFDQIDEIGEENATEADQRVFKIARELRKQIAT